MNFSVFSVDGTPYPGVNVLSLKRNFNVLDGPNAGRVMDGAMTREVIGTYYNYSMEITSNYSNLEEYDSLYEVLSSPADSHSIVVPYGQGTLSFEAYVSNGSDDLLHTRDSFNKWNNLSINFIAMKPQRRASG